MEVYTPNLLDPRLGWWCQGKESPTVGVGRASGKRAEIEMDSLNRPRGDRGESRSRRTDGGGEEEEFGGGNGEVREGKESWI